MCKSTTFFSLICGTIYKRCNTCGKQRESVLAVQRQLPAKLRFRYGAKTAWDIEKNMSDVKKTTSDVGKTTSDLFLSMGAAA